MTELASLPPLPTAQPGERAPWYPEEDRKPHGRCGGCGRFLRWDDYYGRYVQHAVWDDYMGGWEWDC